MKLVNWFITHRFKDMIWKGFLCFLLPFPAVIFCYFVINVKNDDLVASIAEWVVYILWVLVVIGYIYGMITHKKQVYIRG